MKRHSEELSVVLNRLGSSSLVRAKDTPWILTTFNLAHLAHTPDLPCLFSFFHKPTGSLAYSIHTGGQESTIMSLNVPTSDS